MEEPVPAVQDDELPTLPEDQASVIPFPDHVAQYSWFLVKLRMSAG